MFVVSLVLPVIVFQKRKHMMTPGKKHPRHQPHCKAHSQLFL
ncbi:hypothetical protein NITGR_800015 [Nitrospina gracilis 3/211]|uniref:Uncharacterized protein n=1 Tax=Nitrospina gracilis (strain 3/211) TaxID=1266370 RepID=M1Z227_NITG3|nr:hypothetical protein NITGR_800015 [Nitrospina gracilis 3/211]